MLTSDRIASHFGGQVSHETAATVLGIMRGTVDPCAASDETRAWADRCYHRPGPAELKLRAMVQLLDGCGDEAIWGPSATRPVAAYVNTGDTYAPTILFDYQAQRWRLTTVGDFIERFETRYQIA